MGCYVNRQTRKDYFTTKCIVVAAKFEDSVSGMTPVAIDKINKMVELECGGSPSLEVNEVGFAGFLQQKLHYKVNTNSEFITLGYLLYIYKTFAKMSVFTYYGVLK